MGGSCYHKFQILVYKSFCCILHKRCWSVLTLFIIPFFICGMLISLRVGTQTEEHGVETYVTRDVSDLLKWIPKLLDALNKRKLVIQKFNPKFEHSVYIPTPILAFTSVKNESYEKFAKYIEGLWSPPRLTTVNFDSCEALKEKMQKEHYFVGVCVRSEFPKLHYDLVYPTELRNFWGNIITKSWDTHGTDDTHSNFQLSNYDLDHSIYYKEGCLSMQLIVSQFYVNEFSKDKLKISDHISFSAMPHMPFVLDDLFLKYKDPVMHIILTYYMSPSLLIFWLISHEKETPVRKYLKLKNFSIALINISWAVTLLTLTAVLTVPLLLTLKIRWGKTAIFPTSNTLLILLFLLIYCLKNAVFCVMLSGLSATRRSAILIYIVGWSVFFFLETFMVDDENSVKLIVSCLFHNATIKTVLTDLLEKEFYGEGTMFKTFLGSDYQWPLKLVLQVVGVVLFFLLSLLTDQINPGAYLTKFSIIRSIIRRLARRKSSGFEQYFSRSISNMVISSYSRSSFVAEKKKKDDIYIFNAFTVGFEVPSKLLLKEMSFSLEPDDVVALLGPNGSGKTVACLIFSGFLQQTKGQITIDGYDTKYEPKEAWDKVGVAIGNSLLIDGLTVLEQIVFHVGVKGVSMGNVKYDNYLDLCEDMGISKYKNTVVEKLPKTIQNLVAIVCAMCANSRIIVLDGVDYNLDSDTKLTLVSFILKWKKNKTVLFSSTSNSLAEALANNVILLSKGETEVIGDIETIRRASKDSFLIILHKDKNFRTEHLHKLIILIDSYFGGVKIEDPLDRTAIFFFVPKGMLEPMEHFLQDIEANLPSLGLKTINLRETSLIDYYHKVSETAYNPDTDSDAMELIRRYIEAPEQNTILNKEFPLRNPKRSIWHRIKGCLFQSAWISSTLPYQIFYIFLVPVFICVCIIIGHTYGSNYNIVRRRDLDFSAYYKVDLFVSVKHPPRMYQGDYIIANTFWWYREEAWKRGFGIVDTQGLDITDYLGMENSISKSFIYNLKGGIQKERRTQVGGDVPTLSFYSNPIYAHGAASSMNMVLEAFFRSAIDNSISLKVSLDTLPYETHKISNADLKVFTEYVTFMIILTLHFPLMMFVDHYWRNRTTHIINIDKGIAYWIASLILSMPAIILNMIIGAIAIASLKKDTLNGCIGLLVVTIFFLCVYCVYYRILILTICQDYFIANLILLILSFLGYFCDILSRKPRMELSPPKLYWGFLPFYIVQTSLYCIISTTEILSACNIPDIRALSVHYFKCKKLPSCCETDKVKVLRYFNVLFIILLIGLIVVAMILWEYRINMLEHIPGFRINFKKTRESNVSRTSQDIKPGELPTTETRFTKKRAILVEQLLKKRRKATIIKQDLLFVHQGEIFTFHGSMTCGKTALMRLLAKKERPSNGRISIYGESSNYVSSNCPKISFGPQNIKLIEWCSVKRYLLNYGQLIGISAKDIEHVVVDYAQKLNIERYFDTKIRDCSYGTKRRITILMALLGNPKIILLDGSCIGIDHVGVSGVCNILRLYAKLGGTVVIATTNKYFGNLCDRIGLMKNGSTNLVGTIEELTYNYAPGYLLDVQLLSRTEFDKRKNRTMIRLYNNFYVKYSSFIEQKFPQARERRETRNKIVHFIPANKTNFAEIFKSIVENYDALNIGEFNISTNALLTIFEDEEYMNKLMAYQRKKHSNASTKSLSRIM